MPLGPVLEPGIFYSLRKSIFIAEIVSCSSFPHEVLTIKVCLLLYRGNKNLINRFLLSFPIRKFNDFEWVGSNCKNFYVGYIH